MKIALTGAAGLVGQNLVPRLKARGFTDIIAIDKHPANTAILRWLHPDITVIEADLATAGGWQNAIVDADVVILSHAQIGGLDSDAFVANNVTATERVIEQRAVSGGSQFVGGQFCREGLVRQDQGGAGTDRPAIRLSRGCAATNADVRLVRPQACRMAGPLHEKNADLPNTRARPLPSPTVICR
jgi:hypothetical protein